MILIFKNKRVDEKGGASPPFRENTGKGKVRRRVSMKNGKVKWEKGEKYQEKLENCDAYPSPHQKSVFLVLFISWQKKNVD